MTKKQTLNSMVKRLKTAVQALIGLGIFILVILKLLTYLDFTLRWLSTPMTSFLLAHPILETVGHALAFSAAVDLAYMLFTPGPDEAVEPVLLGIAATILIILSSSEMLNHVLETGLGVLFLASAIVLLFYARERFLKSEQAKAELEGVLS